MTRVDLVPVEVAGPLLIAALRISFGTGIMAYGMQWQERALEFPMLMNDDEVDEQFKPAEADELPRFQPIQLIRTYDPRLAAELELLWGYPGFTRYVEKVAMRAQDKTGAFFPLPVLNALLALSRYHGENEQHLQPISVWLVDPTMTRDRPIR